MKQFFFVAALTALFANADTISAQDKKEYPHAIITPNSHPHKAKKINRVAQINCKLKSGELITWSLIYDADALNPGMMNFSRPESIKLETFRTKADALNTTEFWNKIHACLQMPESEFTECVSTLIKTHFDN